MKIASLVSGGVDSSTALYLLQKEQKHDITAFYIKIWMEDNFFDCPWKEDLKFVKNVCKQLGVKLKVVSMQKEYWDKIISYTLSEIKMGNTPNPDVFCNTFIKFGLFYQKYAKDFDQIATGHYAQIQESKKARKQEIKETKNQQINELGIKKTELRRQKIEKKYLCKAVDPTKDQVYFLSQLVSEQVNRCMFPIGHLLKSEVRDIAKKAKLITHNRPDSQGLCFLGKVNFKSFIQKYIGEKRGDVVDLDTGKIIGTHQGYWFYTIGQREGIGIGGSKKPYYVINKNVKDNVIYVTKGRESNKLWQNKVTLKKINILAPDIFEKQQSFTVQLRYHSKEITAEIIERDKDNINLKLSDPVFGVAPGQVGVLYDKNIVVASGIINNP